MISGKVKSKDFVIEGTTIHGATEIITKKADFKCGLTVIKESDSTSSKTQHKSHIKYREVKMTTSSTVKTSTLRLHGFETEFSVEDHKFDNSTFRYTMTRNYNFRPQIRKKSLTYES